MTAIELVNNMGLVILIGIMATVFIQIIIKTLGEERRKNFEISDKILDKTWNRIDRLVKETVQEFKPTKED